MWVSPFRNLRVNGYLLLTAAYRSLSRLSSALSAKASTLRSSSLDLCIRFFILRSDNSSYIALYSVIALLKLNSFKSIKLSYLHLISDVLIYLRCHIFRCSTSFRSITICMQFSRYILTVLSVIRKLKSF